MFWSQAFRVLLFCDSTYLSNTREYLWCIVKKGTCLDEIWSFRSIRCNLILTSYCIIFVSQLQERYIQCSINRFFNAQHYVEYYIERLMSWMYIVQIRMRILWRFRRFFLRQVVKLNISSSVCGFNFIYFLNIFLNLLS